MGLFKDSEEFKKLKEKTLEEIIKEFKINYSYSLHKEIQDSRIKMRLFDVDTDGFRVEKKFEFKNLFFDGLYKEFFIITNFEIINGCERELARELKDFKYKFIPIKEFKKYFDLTVDLFWNGLKIPDYEVKIMYTDYNIVLSVPYDYKNYTKFNILTRNHFYDMDNKGGGSAFTIYKNNVRTYQDMPFLTYINGELFNGKVSKTINTLGDMVIQPIGASDRDIIEIQFTPFLFEVIDITDNNTKFISTEEGKFPISKNGIMTFADGKFLDMEVLPMTSNVFKINESYNIKKSLTLLFFYMENNNDSNDYRDKIEWYRDNYDILEKLDNNLEPEFVKKHMLSNIDLSMNNQVSSGLNNLDYLESKFKDIIQYDYEFYDLYINTFLKNYKHSINSNFIDLKEFDYDSLVRTNNRHDIIDTSNHRNFPVEFILIKVPNPNNRFFNIIIDGIADFETLRYHEQDTTYTYVKKSNTTPDSYIEIEMFDANKDISVINTLGLGTNNIQINNVNFRNGLESIRAFVKDDTTGLFINYNNSIKSLSILENNNTSIDFWDTIPAGLEIKLVNTFVIKQQRYVCKSYKAEAMRCILPQNFWFLSNKDNYRVYKNGRVIPRSSYDFNRTTAGNIEILIHAKFIVGETIMVEYMNTPLDETYYEYTIDEYGRIRLDKGILNTPFNKKIMKYYLNGRKINDPNFDKKCNNGLLLEDVKSRKHFNVLVDRGLYSLIEEFNEIYNTGRDLYDEFIKSIMVGEYIPGDGEDGAEEDVLDKNVDRTGDLYYDLYQEFLKHNLAEPFKKMPEYIVIKYKDLITDDGMLFVKADEKFTHWMPLDATMTHTDDYLLKIDELYFKLLNDIASLTVIDSSDIPADIYEKYKELFENNTLVIDLQN